MKKITDIENKIKWQLYYKLNDWQAWFTISIKQNLSPEFIKEFKDKLNWEVICWLWKLDEDFMIEYQDKLNWEQISQFQHLSINFIRTYKDKINWKAFKLNKKTRLNEKLKEEFKEYLSK